MKKPFRIFLSLLLAASVCVSLPCAAFADGRDTAQSAGNGEETAEPEMTIFDPDELQSMVDSFIQEYSGYGVKADNISFAYTYLATGETWFYNPDTWYYSASMYKVPLMMILAEKESDGELTQESDVKGLTLAYAEESILVYSNNDYAHLMLNYLGTDKEAREMYKQFSSLPDDYYDPDFIDYSYFTVRFMNDVMTTLYNAPERFPHIIDCLKRAQPTDYFHLYIDPELEVAQKYGSYKEFNNTSGIIYTPNPVILTVMTSDLARAELVIGEAAKMFVDYTYTLDSKLNSYKEEKARAEEEAKQKAAEEAAAQAEEEARLAKEAEEKAAAEEAARQAELAAQQAAEERAALMEKIKAAAIVLCVAAAAVVIIVPVIKGRHKTGTAGHSGGGYTPRH